MQLVIIESPYAGDVAGNVSYAKVAVRDCLTRGEAPIASHLLFTQGGILDDSDPAQRLLGIKAGLAWYEVENATVVFYMDKGFSDGMIGALRYSAEFSPMTEFRWLGTEPDPFPRGGPLPGREEFFDWGFGHVAACEERVANVRFGRLQARRHRRPPTEAAPYEATFRGTRVAFYATMADALRGLELFYWHFTNVSRYPAPIQRLEHWFP